MGDISHRNIPHWTGPPNRDHDLPTGGEPPHNDEMEARVSKLEAAAQDTRDRLARIETRMETFATKADVSDLRADFHREINSQTWKFVTWMTGICTALIGATYFIANHVAK